MKLFALWFLLLYSLINGYGSLAAAQNRSDCTAYDCFPKKPQLVGGGGGEAISATIEKWLSYPPRALRDKVEGRVFIRIDIPPSGVTRNIMVIKSLRLDCDAAAMRAVRHLPHFEPRPHSADTVRYYLPIMFKLPAAKLPDSNTASYQTTLGTIVDPVERSPELLSGGGGAAIVAAVQQRLVYPPQAKRVGTEGRVFVGFTITPEGLVKDAHVWKGFRPDCDEAALQAVRKLPRFKPCLQFGKPVTCGYTVPVKFALPPKRKLLK
ncbi:energy transducer TonB [Hymenobacter cheonanensis]|uniref:energy transducer TonB n=1 Tax=Hymenobacter sp. CA2-7 TaxID=3063993 RepID=UPI0027122E48|nr:energy transducer TonB [Hymenobacter sp. CA2-7]MDO7884936.1 energy transducer TonB [Hymenobacter sp. CA2-7]